MESKSNSMQLPSLRARNRSDPDVPEDVAVALLHLNDPNWDFDGSDSSSFTESVLTSEKDSKHYASSIDMGKSSHAGTSDYDTESQTDSRMHFRSIEALDYEE